MLAEGIDHIEREHTDWANGETSDSVKVVFNTNSFDSSTWNLRVTNRDGKFVVTSITKQNDGGYMVRGRLLQKGGTAFRRNYSEHLGFLYLDVFGMEAV